MLLKHLKIDCNVMSAIDFFIRLYIKTRLSFFSSFSMQNFDQDLPAFNEWNDNTNELLRLIKILMMIYLDIVDRLYLLSAEHHP